MVPVTSRTSACRGLGTSSTPKRSASYLGVRAARISMSQPLQEAALTWKTQMDRFLAQAVRPDLKLATPHEQVPPYDDRDYSPAADQEQKRIESSVGAKDPARSKAKASTTRKRAV